MTADSRIAEIRQALEREAAYVDRATLERTSEALAALVAVEAELGRVGVLEEALRQLAALPNRTPEASLYATLRRVGQVASAALAAASEEATT